MPESNTQTNNLPKDDASYRVEVAVQHALDVDVKRLQLVSQTILRDHEIVRAAISIAVVDDPTIRELNRNYLQHDYATDVLSFALGSDETQKIIEGEIIVSGDTAARVAAEINISQADELLLYVVHGLLHLVGYGDKSVEKRDAMRAAEQKYMTIAGAQYSAPTEDLE